MFRLLHFADLHLGVENYGHIDPRIGVFSRLTDFLRSLDQIADHALEQEVDLVIFAGDACKSRAPSPTYQREFAQRIRQLSAAGILTVLVVGNHDIPSALGRANAVEIFDTLETETPASRREAGVSLWQSPTAFPLSNGPGAKAASVTPSPPH